MIGDLDGDMSNLRCVSGEGSGCSGLSRNDNGGVYPPPPVKKKRTQPGHPEPGAEVIALSPTTLMATNRFVCEVCKKGFQRDQNLQLHRRGHNLPWKLKQKTTKQVIKKVYICPETTCVHHDPTRALGDLTGIKKHFYRKHGEKKWKCEKCSKKYAVQSDWKAHSKICGTREYRCDCGTIFSRRDSFITHRAFCDALAQENARNNSISLQNGANRSLESDYNYSSQNIQFPIKKEQQNFLPPWITYPPIMGPTPPLDLTTPPFITFQDFNQTQDYNHLNNPNPSSTPPPPPPPHISATALLQKASQMGSKSSNTHFPSPTGMFIRPHHPHVPGFAPSSRNDFAHGLASFGNKAAAAAVQAGGGTDSGGATAGGDSNPLMMMQAMDSSSAGFGGPGFDDMASFGEMLARKGLGATGDEFSGAREGEGMTTRDFLGLRPLLSQSDILSFSTALDCINSVSCDGDQNLAQKSWQD